MFNDKKSYTQVVHGILGKCEWHYIITLVSERQQLNGINKFQV